MQKGVFGFVLCVLSVSASGQQLRDADEQILDATRARYYNLQARGLDSFHCTANFDLATLPQSFLPDSAVQERALLERTGFNVEIGHARPVVDPVFPKDTTAIAQQEVAQYTGLMKALLSGFFQTWPTKGLQGPIPPFSKWVDSITPAASGYVIKSRPGTGLVSIEMSKDFLVTRITSIAGKVDEHPVYLDTPEGLIYSGNEAVDDTNPNARTIVRFDIQNTLTDGFRLPSKIRMQVNDNLDVRFSLTGCTVKKSTVLQLPATQ